MMGSLLALAFTLALAVFAIAVLRVHRDRKRAWGCLDDAGIRRGLDVLLKRGYDGAVAVLTDAGSGRFIQFRKYIPVSGTIGLEMHFPRTSWSEPYYAGVQDTLRRHNVTFDRLALDAEPTIEVVHADFRLDVSCAALVAAEIMRDVFDISTLCVEMKANDICPLEELVDRVDHPRPANLLFRRIRGKRSRELVGDRSRTSGRAVQSKE